jgi:hypothetical protein
MPVRHAAGCRRSKVRECMREFDREAAGSLEGAVTADVMQVTVRLNPASKPPSQTTRRANQVARCFLAVQPRLKKHFGFSETQISCRTPAVPSHSEGRFAIVTNAGRDAVDANHATDESVCLRTAKSCGPDAPTLASSRRSDPPVRVARKPGHPGERVISRKPLRGECRVIPV